MNDFITVIGAGLAGCEAANAITSLGIAVRLIDMKPQKKSPAHKSDNFAELVCSNSLKAARIESAAGLLKAEMRRLGSICLEAADICSVPAGGALAVERNQFSSYITEKIKLNKLITFECRCVTDIPSDGITVIATGPLTDGLLAESISRYVKNDYLNFYDAAAPIVSFDSVDMSEAFFASRYGKGDGDDYINCPMDKEQYLNFHKELVNAERAPLKEFDKQPDVYEGCMPIEILASRGVDAIRFGPMKPVGLVNPKTGHRPWAVLQLRKENREGTMYNLVGFQTNLKFGEQKRIFSMIPGLGNAEFFRYGVMHRNSFINSPKLLSHDLSFINNNNIFFAGQLSGVEGYMESAASGIVCGINAAARFMDKPALVLPTDTMTGALLGYITDQTVERFEPMGANFGVMPEITPKIRDKKERYAAVSARAQKSLEKTIGEYDLL